MSGTSTGSRGYDAGQAHPAVRVLEQAGRSADRCQARCDALDAVTLNHLGVEVAYAEQAQLAQAGVAAVDERDTTCCYARQDKFWVTGFPGGERWEICTVLQDSATFWGQDGEQRCGCPQAASATGDEVTGVCCA